MLLSWLATNLDMKLPGFFAEASLYRSTEEYRLIGTFNEASEATFRQQNCDESHGGLCNGTFTDLNSDRSYGRFEAAYDSEQTAVVPAFGPCPENQQQFCYRIRGKRICWCECPVGTYMVADNCQEIGCSGTSGAKRVFVSPYLAICMCPHGTKRCPPKGFPASCVNTNESPNNCGACGRICEKVPEHGMAGCKNGKCTLECPPGKLLVNGKCEGTPPINGKCPYNQPTECMGVCGCFCDCPPTKMGTCRDNTVYC